MVKGEVGLLAFPCDSHPDVVVALEDGEDEGPAVVWSAVDCAISTSDNEGMPVALIEAQLAGVPVIATNVGSNSEVVEVGVTGVIVSKEINEIVNVVQKMVEDQSLSVSMSVAAKKWALKEFSLRKMLEMHMDAYVRIGLRKGL